MDQEAKKVFEGEIFSVWQWEQELYDGSTVVFEKVTRPNYASVVGVLPNANVLLAWDEQPHRQGVLTTPGGRIEDDESPQEGARREFLEETGYEIGDLRDFFSYRPAGKIDHEVFFFVGRDLRKVQEPMLDSGERIELREFTFEDFLLLGRSDSEKMGGPVRDKMLRIMLLEAQLDEVKKKELYQKLYE